MPIGLKGNVDGSGAVQVGGSDAITISTGLNATFAGAITAASTVSVPAGPLITESMTLLGTLNTTSGTTQTLSGLNLTGYKFLQLWLNNVSSSVTTNSYLLIDGQRFTSPLTSATNGKCGFVFIDLSNGNFVSEIAELAAGASPQVDGTPNSFCGRTSYTTSSTSITIATNGSTYDAGSIAVYGVK